MRALLVRWSLLGFLLTATAAYGQTTLTVSPTLTVPGGTVTAAWSGIAPTSAYDWIGLYASASASDSAPMMSLYTNAAASGSRQIIIPSGAAPGTAYEMRLFRNGSYTRLATSNAFTVGMSVSGTVTVGASNLAGAAFSATNGGTCGSSNAFGQYTCTVPPSWSGTITPSRTGYVFSPTSRNYSNVAANQTTQNYVAGTAIHQVSGTVTAGGAPLSNVAFAATNAAAYAVTCSSSDASGLYSCSAMQGWSGTVTPSMSAYVFTPASRTYSSLASSQASQNYAGALTYQITGAVMSAGSPLAGVTLTGTGGAACSSSNAAGQYTCTVPEGWSGSVTPSLANHVFTPLNRQYSAVSANQSAQDYSATAYYQLTGTVTAGGSGLASVSFAATAGGTCSSSNASGQYSCTVPHGWSGVVTPSRNGYLFVPASLSHNNVTAHQSGYNYAATMVSGATPIHYIHVDHLNTPRLVADAAGTTVWKWDQQEPFGYNVPDENPIGLGLFDLPLRLPGQYFDKETLLHQNNARDYDASIGRYIESDPIGLAGGLNTYAYVASDPLHKVDPTGLFFDIFATGGIQGGFHVLSGGMNVTCGYVVSVGASCQACRYCTVCVRLGPGLYVGGGVGVGGGIATGDISNFAGDSLGGGFDVGAGLVTVGASGAVGVTGNVFTGPMGTPVSVAAVRGRYGVGWGASAGVELCRTKILACDVRLWGNRP